MPDIASKILSAGGPVDLSDAGAPEIGDAIEELLNHPGGSALFVSLCQTGTAACLDGAAELVDRTPDPGVMVEVVCSLSAGLRIDQATVRRLHKSFLAKAGDASWHPATRSQALMGALVLSGGRPGPTRLLQAHLIDTGTDDDGNYLRHATKVMGLLLAQVDDGDLRLALASLLDVPEAEDEASMALGLLALAQGLDESERSGAVRRFEEARSWFRRSAGAAEVRLDADLHARCLDFLLAFGEGGSPAEIHASIGEIRASAFAWSAHLVPSNRPLPRDPWSGAATLKGVHWASLAFRLGALETSLGEATWLNGAMVVEEELLMVYTASRSVFRRDADGGLEAVVRPRIVGALQRERRQLDVLDAWIDRRAVDGPERHAAMAMRSAVLAAMEASVTRNPTEASTARPTAVAIVRDSGLGPAEQREALELLQSTLASFDIELAEPIVAELWMALHERLLTNFDYRTKPLARAFFGVILFHTLGFLASRDNLGTTSTTGTDYLFDLSVTAPPVEDDLHRDYYGFLEATRLRPTDQKEAQGIGHGRADVLFEKDGFKIVAELKKHDRDSNLAELVRKFGLQTTSYQRTNVTFCILMVLDLVDRGGGGGHIREKVAVVEKIPGSGATTYSVVVFRIQGRQRSPANVVGPSTAVLTP
ncbi:hypothetical protein [Aureimonas jatrophae]|uniref:Uncharacterized protein n=1 Tax=Aureimonas jatrophae TaxID=1166073 RepID=A0A1H0LGT2_9HYPH|nr:hypothetical protein [Aureimonas jatrophae]MBB3952510.1 hypothetical protein [Aureimonas jatrophae]SDO67295.1 hypothetical protein SAMN05192530_11027 [Aureimonas jatrophae]